MKKHVKLGKAKGKSLEKPGLGKGKVGKAKAKAKAKSKLGKVCKRNLDKMGKLSLQEKVQQATEAAEDPEEQAEELQKNLSTEEKKEVWGKHNTYLKHNPLEKEEHNQLSKKDKGTAACLWFLKKEGKRFIHTSQTVKASESLEKEDFWMTEKEALDKFGERDLNLHIESGRVVWREDPCTYNCWQYKDLHAWKKKVQLNRGKKWQSGQEYEPDEEDLEKFRTLYDEDAMNLDHEISQLEGRAKGSGKTSGKHLGKGKGKGLGKGKGKGAKEERLAIKDKEPDDEEELPEDEALKDALKKARKARDSVSAAMSNLEEALGKAKSSLSRQGKAVAEGYSSQLAKNLQTLKEVLGGKKAWKSHAIKKFLEEVAKNIKGAKDETKELKALGNKAASVAGSRKSK
eukprot:s1262_g8.t1